MEGLDNLMPLTQSSVEISGNVTTGFTAHLLKWNTGKAEAQLLKFGSR